MFDSAAKFKDRCLNESLYQGPDGNNALRAVITRFRRHPYAATADVENMFHQIAIPDDQKTYMRFFWFQDNDPDKPLIEYWSKVHLMANKPSPAIASLTVKYAARENPPNSGNSWIQEDDLLDPLQPKRTREPDEVEHTLVKQFYVDDCLISEETPDKTADILKEGIDRFSRYGLNLCKSKQTAHKSNAAFRKQRSSQNWRTYQSPTRPQEHLQWDSPLGSVGILRRTHFTLKWNSRIDLIQDGDSWEISCQPMTQKDLVTPQ